MEQELTRRLFTPFGVAMAGPAANNWFDPISGTPHVPSAAQPERYGY